MSKVIRLLDRTRTVADWTCERSRYLGYELEGRGITKSTLSLELFLGIAVHDALATIASLHQESLFSIDELARTAFYQVYDRLIEGKEEIPEAKEFASEQGTLVEGLVRGFYKHVWPRLMEQYPRIVATETEMLWPLLESEEGLNLHFMTKPDLVMEDKNGELVYVEYKTTSSKKDKWINSWDTAVQLHSSIRATERTLGKHVSQVQIVGLYKGYESYGKQGSPFCYAYKKSGNPPFTQDQIVYEYKPGFKRYATWELPGGVKDWVEGMPEDIIASQFPMTAPIFVNEDLINAFFRQRKVREETIAVAVSYLKDERTSEQERLEILDEVFPQKFDKCSPSFGWECQFKNICHGSVPYPLSSGYKLRTPHHKPELDLFKE